MSDSLKSIHESDYSEESAEQIQAKLAQQSELERKVERLAKAAKLVEEENRLDAMGLGMLYAAGRAVDDLEYQLPVKRLLTSEEMDILRSFKRMLRAAYDREVK